MRESEVEKHLVKRVKEHGGIPYKFTSPGRCNVPDRLVVFPGGWIFFIETKAPKKSLRPGQVRERHRLEKQGCTVEVLKTKEDVDIWIEGMTA